MTHSHGCHTRLKDYPGFPETANRRKHKMKCRMFRSAVATLALMFFVGCGKSVPTPDLSLTALDVRFMAGCRIRPSELLKDPYFGLLPFHHFVPQKLSLTRLEKIGVEELVLLCGSPADDGTERSDREVEWALSAQLSQAADLPTILKSARQSLVDHEPTHVEPIAINISGHSWCVEGPCRMLFPRTKNAG